MAKKDAVKRFDVIVIGAGSGLEISSYASAKGLKVAIVEPGPFGGTCLNRGCIPSKMLIHHADVAEEIKRSNEFGITAKITKIDWKKIVAGVNKIVDAEAREIEHANRQDKNVTVYNVFGHFVGEKLLKVGKEVITADKIFIGAGARPSIPEISGLNNVPFITSDEALKLKKQPKKLVIIGGGYIAAELAHFFQELGTRVTILQRGKVLVNNEDFEIAQKYTEIAQRKYTVILNAAIKQISKKGENILVSVAVNGKNKTVTGDAVLIAAGRIPNTDVLNVKATGVLVNERGFVAVNEYLETNVSGVWAFGDIAGVYMFKHSANLEAEYAITNAFGKKVPVDYSAMPHAVFSSPQIAGVGKTESELKKQNVTYRTSIYNYENTGYGLALKEKDGFVKMLVNQDGSEILGCHIIGPQASILIHEVIVAMKANLGVKGIVNAVHIHPALSEVVQRAFGSLL